MIKQFFPASATRERLFVGPLANDIDRFAAMLASRGYARSTARDKLRLLGHLSEWLRQRKLGVADLDERLIDRFRRHRVRRGRVDRATVPTCRALLAFLRESGRVLVLDEVIEHSALDRLAYDFAHYLTRERGLAPATLLNYVPIARCFLRERFGGAPPRLDELHIQFVVFDDQHRLAHSNTLRSAVRVADQSQPFDTVQLNADSFQNSKRDVSEKQMDRLNPRIYILRSDR